MIDDSYYRREISREELIRLAEHFLSRALERAPE
jgi:20S proteasome alpha/beta subunit